MVVLNDIYIDVLDYIIPATCSDTEFRAMWAEFEWENKVSHYVSIILHGLYCLLCTFCTTICEPSRGCV